MRRLVETGAIRLRRYEPSVMWRLLGLDSLGVVLIAAGGAAARHGSSAWAEAGFWAGLLVMTGPTAWRLASTRPSRTERIALVAGFGVAMYLAKVMIWPVQFTFHDEFVHWRTTGDILASHHLFLPNPLTPVSSSYPGSEIITAAVVQLTGLTVFVSGLIVVGISRLILILAIFLVFERVSSSSRVGGLACILYACNPNFIFFDAQFSYETVALSLGVFLLYLGLRSRDLGWRSTVTHGTALGLTGASLAITHHLTSWLFSIGIVVLLLIDAAMRRKSRALASWLPLAAIVATALILLWLSYVGADAISYVGPTLTGGGSALLHLIEGQSAPRTLFVSADQVSPLWEQMLAIAGVGAIVATLPFSLARIARRHRDNPYLIFLALVAAVYPLSLALRFTSSSVEASTRLSEFLFFGVAGVIAVQVHEQGKRRARAWKVRARKGAWVCLITLAVGSGVIVGFGRWARLPGPYLVSADQRSVEPQGLSAASWMRSHLGLHNRIATDRINALLMGSPLGGAQHPVSGLADGISMNQVMLGTRLTASDRETLARGHVRYLVVDDRLSRGLPLTGWYVEAPERVWRRPVSVAAARKFARDASISRLFDSGNITIDAVPLR